MDMNDEDQRPLWRAYGRFGAMIATSTVVMYLLTYTNVFAFAHIHYSQERLYMALTMGAAMAVVMLSFMWRMYPSLVVNISIVAGAVALAAVAFTFSQRQLLIGDELYMRGMIPHHSIAILTSERAGIEDLRVRELADGISDTQVREIAEMEWLLADIQRNGRAITPVEADARPVPDFSDLTAE